MALYSDLVRSLDVDSEDVKVEKEILFLTLRTNQDYRRGLLCNGAILELGLGLKAMIGVCPDYEHSTNVSKISTKKSSEIESLQSPMEVPSFSNDTGTNYSRDGRRGLLTRRRVLLSDVMKDDDKTSTGKSKRQNEKKRKRKQSTCSTMCKRIYEIFNGSS